MGAASSILVAAEGVRHAKGWLELWMGLMLAGVGEWRGCEVVTDSGVTLFRDGDVTSAELVVRAQRCSVRIAGATGRVSGEARLLAEALDEAATRFSRIDADVAMWRLEGGLSAGDVRTALIDDQMRYVSVNEHLAHWHNQDVALHTGRTLREVIGVIAESAEPVVSEVLSNGVMRKVTFTGGIIGEAGQAYQVLYSPINIGDRVLCRAEVRAWKWRGSERDAQASAVATARVMHLQDRVSAAVRWELAEGVHEVRVEAAVFRRAVREALRACSRARTSVVSSRIVGDDLAMVFRSSVLDRDEVRAETKERLAMSGGAVFVADDVQFRFPLR